MNPVICKSFELLDVAKTVKSSKQRFNWQV